MVRASGGKTALASFGRLKNRMVDRARQWRLRTLFFRNLDASFNQAPWRAFFLKPSLPLGWLFVYKRYFHLGLLISGTTLLSCLGYLIYDWRKHKKTTKYHKSDDRLKCCTS